MSYPERCYYNVPPEIAVQEANNLYEWGKYDKSLLEKDDKLFLYYSELPLRADCLKVAQSRWVEVRTAGSELKQRFYTMLDEARKLRSKLEHDFFYFLRDEPKKIVALRKIAKRKGLDSLIQSLTDLGIMGNEAESLKNNPLFDYSLVDKAAKMSDDLADLSGAFHGSANKLSEPSLVLRNKASWHLKEAVDEIRGFGQWKHNGNPGRHEGYVSAFLREKRKRIADDNSHEQQ